MMSPAEGYRLAEFQRPGVVICMRPDGCRDRMMAPLSYQQLKKLPGDWSWEDRKLRILLGYIPSTWAKNFAYYAATAGHITTVDEWNWLHGNASLIEARAWLYDLSEQKLTEVAS